LAADKTGNRPMITFEQARSMVKEKLAAARVTPPVETVPLDQARGRILAEDVMADRDIPPFHRATRDGYAVRSAEVATVPVELECEGEARAGKPWLGHLSGRRVCVEIMTGAPLPEGADAVVMVEHTQAGGSKVEVLRAVGAYENVVRRGSEAQAGRQVLGLGRKLHAGEIGLLASVGITQVRVFRRPAVAILPTGDEVVPAHVRPQWFQIRNSNAATLAAQVEGAGGVPRVLGIAPDQLESLRALIEEGLKSDLLLLSGGVSAGKFDFVEGVLAELGTEFYFRGVAIRPGKPLVFGRACGKFFFGLPGNPVSTYVTFELFARPALAMLAGADAERPVFLRARLGKPLRQKSGLTAFLPARVESVNGEPVVDPVGWQGSGDLVGVVAANCFLVVHPQQTDLAAGEWVDVLRMDD
jgi:molybdopterin molybdotransferase